VQIQKNPKFASASIGRGGGKNGVSGVFDTVLGED